jgi:hypothetical protein
MSSHFTVVYDACVLYPAPLRDLLMHLALSDLYRARWSDMIHDEWMRNVLANRPDLNREQLNRTCQLMNAHVRDSLVTGFEYPAKDRSGQLDLQEPPNLRALIEKCATATQASAQPSHSFIQTNQE